VLGLRYLSGEYASGKSHVSLLFLYVNSRSALLERGVSQEVNVKVPRENFITM
jgi:hypothetical protein